MQIISKTKIPFLILFLIYFFTADNLLAQTNYTTNLTIAQNDYDEDFDFDFEFGSDESSNSTPQIYDPLEKINRTIFGFNDNFDQYVFEPTAKGYRKIIPKFIRKSIRNFFTNLSLPITTVNSILQGNVENSLASFSHFLINSTIGIGGLFDVAGKKNIKYRNEDFGQTFAKYGIGQGPYLVLPFFGPATLRSTGGLVTEKLLDPLSFNVLKVGGDEELLDSKILISLAIIEAIDKREALIEIIADSRKDSFDFYATVRSAYIQKRNFEINNK